MNEETDAGTALTVRERELLDTLEGITRLHVWTNDLDKITSASALWDEADALAVLAQYGRFRVTGGGGSRLVHGYWPENDPEITNAHGRLTVLMGEADAAQPAIPRGDPLPIRWVFTDWQYDGASVYNTEHGRELSKGSLHSGSTFRGTIVLNPDDERDLRSALGQGYQPVFRLLYG